LHNSFCQRFKRAIIRVISDHKEHVGCRKEHLGCPQEEQGQVPGGIHLVMGVFMLLLGLLLTPAIWGILTSETTTPPNCVEKSASAF
jgi:hypothetical protein